MDRRYFGLLIGSAPFLRAADPWKDKQPADWTNSDIQKLRERSPWAKEAEASQTSKPMLGSNIPSATSEGAGATGGSRTVDRSALDGGEPLRALVRWESAQPLIDSAKRPRSKQAEMFYIVSASGLPVYEQHIEPKDPSAVGEQVVLENKPIIIRLKERTTIERKGKDPIRPERVELIEGKGMRVPVFFFARKRNPITLEDKEVIFHSRYGAIELKTKFTLKDMVYQGKLEL